MQRFVLASVICAFMTGGAFAQNYGAPAAPTTPEPATQAPPAAQETGKEAREKCRADAIAQGLKGDARKAAVAECFAKARPDLAKRQECRKEGIAKGLSDSDLKAYVKQCKSGAQ